MDKEDTVYIFNGIFSYRKEGNPATWMDLLGILLCEISQSKKTNTICHHLYVDPKKAELIETESRMIVARSWAIGDVGRCWLRGINFQLKDD